MHTVKTLNVIEASKGSEETPWEDMAGRRGDIRSVSALRSNIKVFAGNSAEAKKAWVDDPTLEAWIIWNIWQVSNPSLADIVEVEPEFRIYRDTGIVLTNIHFSTFLPS